MKVGTIDKKQKSRAFYVYPEAAACTGLEVGACAVKRSHGRNEVLQKKTLQSGMAYLDAFTMKLLETQPTWLLLNVFNRIDYVDSVSLPCTSPQSQNSLPLPDLLHSE